MTTTLHAVPVLTAEQKHLIAEAATKAYFDALVEQGRPYVHSELNMMIELAIEGEETRLFIAANR
jgi:hypothetical protein